MFILALKRVRTNVNAIKREGRGINTNWAQRTYLYIYFHVPREQTMPRSKASKLGSKDDHYTCENISKHILNRKKKGGVEEGAAFSEHSAREFQLWFYFHNMLHLYSRIMLFSGANPTQALRMFSSIARCFDNAFTTGVPGGTCNKGFHWLNSFKKGVDSLNNNDVTF